MCQCYEQIQDSAIRGVRISPGCWALIRGMGPGPHLCCTAPYLCRTYAAHPRDCMYRCIYLRIYLRVLSADFAWPCRALGSGPMTPSVDAMLALEQDKRTTSQQHRSGFVETSDHCTVCAAVWLTLHRVWTLCKAAPSCTSSRHIKPHQAHDKSGHAAIVGWMTCTPLGSRS